jgi:hypothetical protein
MTSEESQIFKLLDTYARERHSCFLAEMFPSGTTTVYTLCFRPTGAERDPLNRYACRYLYFGIGDVKASAEQGELSPSIIETLDKELEPLGKLV